MNLGNITIEAKFSSGIFHLSYALSYDTYRDTMNLCRGL